MNGARLLKHFLAEKSPLTALAYKKDLEDFSLHLRIATVDTAIEKLFGASHPTAQRLVGAYLAAMRRRGLAPATINRRLSTLRSIGKRARILGQTPWVLEAANVKMENVRETKGPGRENVLKIFNYLRAQPATKPVLRDLAILRLSYDLGLRRGEICGVNTADIVPEGLRVRRKGKQSKKPLVLPEATRGALKAWIKVRGEQAGALFINFDEIHRSKTGRRLSGSAIYQIVRDRAREAGVTVPVRPHGIRHTAITDARVAAARRGYGLDELVDFSGHADVRTLKHYLDDQKSVQGAISTDIALPG